MSFVNGNNIIKRNYDNSFIRFSRFPVFEMDDWEYIELYDGKFLAIPSLIDDIEVIEIARSIYYYGASLSGYVCQDDIIYIPRSINSQNRKKW